MSHRRGKPVKRKKPQQQDRKLPVSKVRLVAVYVSNEYLHGRNIATVSCTIIIIAPFLAANKTGTGGKCINCKNELCNKIHVQEIDHASIAADTQLIEVLTHTHTPHANQC